MKVVIFAGGKGSRIESEAMLKPKPMIEIGGKPILWHIMKIYAHYGHNDFIICLGYMGYAIKEYFLNYLMHNADFTIDIQNNKIDIHHSPQESFKITFVETGMDTMTAGRLARVKAYIGEEDFMLTYGDGLIQMDMEKQLEFHRDHGKICTMTVVEPTSRFGMVALEEDDLVSRFSEKPQSEGAWMNGGFFILKSKIFDYLPSNSDIVMWEREPLESLTKNEQLVAYRHQGFWKCMDTMRDNKDLNNLWASDPQWKCW